MIDSSTTKPATLSLEECKALTRGMRRKCIIYSCCWDGTLSVLGDPLAPAHLLRFLSVRGLLQEDEHLAIVQWLQRTARNATPTRLSWSNRFLLAKS